MLIRAREQRACVIFRLRSGGFIVRESRPATVAPCASIIRRCSTSS
jgi:hypothetical protein